MPGVSGRVVRLSYWIAGGLALLCLIGSIWLAQGEPPPDDMQIYSMQRQMKKRMMREAPLSPRQWKKFKKQMQKEDRA